MTPKRIHIWVGEQSLCTLHDRSEAVASAGTEPFCGACIIAIELLDAYASHAIAVRDSDPDVTPSQAHDSLRGSWWGRRFNLDQMIPVADWTAILKHYDSTANTAADPRS